jgi:polyhydroxybutyrate depolymerase
VNSTSLLRCAIAALVCASAAFPFSVRAQDRQETVKVNGFTRTMEVHLPAGYTKEKRYPVVLALHDAGADAGVMALLTHFNQIADRSGFIVVYPNARDGRWTNVENANVRTYPGIGRRNPGPIGAGGVRPNQAGGSPADDNLFFDNLLDQIESEYSVDTSRVFATGYSDGGFMDFRLGCQLAGRIAAIAPVAASLPTGLSESCANWAFRSVPLLMINGTSDRVVFYEGRLSYSPGYFLMPVKDSIKTWAKIDGCNNKPAKSALPASKNGGNETNIEDFQDCKEGSAVTLYTIEKGGHQWPGGLAALTGDASDNRGGDFDASEVIWKFFAAHPMHTSQ